MVQWFGLRASMGVQSLTGELRSPAFHLKKKKKKAEAPSFWNKNHARLMGRFSAH